MENQEQEKEVKKRGRPKGSKNKTKDVNEKTKTTKASSKAAGTKTAGTKTAGAKPAGTKAAAVPPKRGKRLKTAIEAVEKEKPAPVEVNEQTLETEIVPAPAPKKKVRATKKAAKEVVKEAAKEAETERPSELPAEESVEQPQGEVAEVKKRRKRPTTTYVNSIVGMVDINTVGASISAEGQALYRSEADALPVRQVKSATEEEQTNLENAVAHHESKEISGVKVEGVFEFADPIKNEYGFLRKNGISSENDIYVSPSFARKFNLKSGEYVKGIAKAELTEKYRALLFVNEVNGVPPYMSRSNNKFDDMTPLFPRERFHLSMNSSDIAMRIIDLIAPVGKGQRGLIVAPPKSGKTILLQKIAKSIKDNYPDVELMILLIDERPEEVTDMKEVVDAPVFYSTFDELPQNHIRIAELVLNRARGLVEMGRDVVILLDSITRLARAYNIALPASGRTLSGGLDTNALHRPKRFLGSARNMQEGGSLTIMATALIETGSKMDDVIFEEFKGTGNMELILDRKLSEKRIFPSIDIRRSGTRREELLLNKEEYEAVLRLRRAFDQYNTNEPVELLSEELMRNRTNEELVKWINTAFADKTTRK